MSKRVLMLRISFILMWLGFFAGYRGAISNSLVWSVAAFSITVTACLFAALVRK